MEKKASAALPSFPLFLFSLANFYPTPKRRHFGILKRPGRLLGWPLSDWARSDYIGLHFQLGLGFKFEKDLGFWKNLDGLNGDGV